VGRGADLPCRRPRRPGDPAIAAADRDPRGARLHPRRAGHGAGRGLGRDAAASFPRQPQGRHRRPPGRRHRLLIQMRPSRC
jgi:hypothetical protein